MGTPGYMVREEWQRGKLRERAGGRTWGFERRLEEGRGSEIARECWEEVKKRAISKKELSKWELGRKRYLEVRGVGVGREEGEMDCGMVLERDRELQRKERCKKIRIQIQ